MVICGVLCCSSTPTVVVLWCVPWLEPHAQPDGTCVLPTCFCRRRNETPTKWGKLNSCILKQLFKFSSGEWKCYKNPNENGKATKKSLIASSTLKSSSKWWMKTTRKRVLHVAHGGSAAASKRQNGIHRGNMHDCFWDRSRHETFYSSNNKTLFPKKQVGHLLRGIFWFLWILLFIYLSSDYYYYHFL